MNLGIVSDEISTDFKEAISHGTSWGVSLYELRCLVSGRIPNVESRELATVRSIIRDTGVKITALSPGIFKHHLSQKALLEKELDETLPRTIDIAQEFGVGLIIVFGFQRETNEPPENFHEAVRFFRRAAERVREAGLRLAVENEPGFWCDTGTQTARILRETGSPVFGANWDPCNSFGESERVYPEGYQAIRPYIVNVHMKDTARGALVECVPIGEGVIDWEGQLGALVRDEAVDHVTIETHCLPLIEKSKQNVDTVRRMLSAISVQKQHT